MATLTQLLREQTLLDSAQRGTSPLFVLHSGKCLNHSQCWRIVDCHRSWIQEQINAVIRKSSKNSEHSHDVVIGYLGDNSIDLLLSLLGCTELSGSSGCSCNERILAPSVVVPAMINVRWTPAEIERALRPSQCNTKVLSNNQCEGKPREYQSSSQNVKLKSTTIILYGEGYADAAKAAAALINKKCSGTPYGDDKLSLSIHTALALALPNFGSDYILSSDALGSDLISYDNQESTNESRSLGGDLLYHNVENSNSEDAIILFTSGTSSPSGAKGVRLSHRSLLVQAFAKTLPPCNYDFQTAVVATTVPWFHVGGISSALAVVMSGGRLVFPPKATHGAKKSGFQPSEIILTLMSNPTVRLQRSEKQSSAGENESNDRQSLCEANTLVVVPTMLHSMFEHINRIEPFTNRSNNHQLKSFSNVRLVLVGGQSIGSKDGRLFQQTRYFFPNARVVQTYACTEAGSSITFEDLGFNNAENSGDVNEKDELIENIGIDGATCVGTPPSHIEIGIFSSSSGEMQGNSGVPTLLPGRVGIIGTRGPHVMSGYWNRGGDVKRNPSSKFNWMLTNDLGYIHPKNFKLYFCGRANDVIRTGGESVLAAEVERVLILHDDISECAVFGLPDQKFGEAVCVAIVPKKLVSKDADVDGDCGALTHYAADDVNWKEQIRNFCAEKQMAGFKTPRRVFCMKSLPRNSSGKVLKYKLVNSCGRINSGNASSIDKIRSRL